MGVVLLNFIQRVTVPIDVITKNVGATLEGILSAKFKNACVNNAYILKVTKFLNKDNLRFEINDECSVVVVCKFQAEALQYNVGELIQGEIVYRDDASAFCRVVKNTNIIVNVTNHTLFRGLQVGNKLPLAVQFVRYTCDKMIINANILTHIPLFSTVYVYEASGKPILPTPDAPAFLELDPTKKKLYAIFYDRSKRATSSEMFNSSKKMFLFDSVIDGQMYGTNGTAPANTTVVKLPLAEMLYTIATQYNEFVEFINNLELSDNLILLYENLRA